MPAFRLKNGLLLLIPTQTPTPTPQPCTLTYNGNAAYAPRFSIVSNVPAAVTAVYGTSVLITSDLPICSDTSYYCSSWNTLANGNGTTYETGDSLVLTADVTLYAQWSQSAGISTPGGSSVVMSAATPTPQAQVSEQEADNNAGQGDDAERNDDVLQNRDGDQVYPETVYEYEYANTAWQDQLTAIKTYTVDASGVQTLSDTQSFAYDAMGNPTSYLGKTLTWEGKQLAGVSAAGQSVSYAYDENGLRTQKTVDGTTTNYYYNGSLLIGITVGYRVMRFSYDSSGNVVAMDYSTDYGANFTTYYYFRNGQGDIIKLINDNGTVAATYEYDSWGNITAIGGTLPQTLAIYQPFRYRGYVYDTETGWYYLQSRYYDPTTCRFISSDVMLSTGQGVLGHNSYAYCLNNPIRYQDSLGSYATDADGERENGYNERSSYDGDYSAAVAAQVLKDCIENHQNSDTLLFLWFAVNRLHTAYSEMNCAEFVSSALQDMNCHSYDDCAAYLAQDLCKEFGNMSKFTSFSDLHSGDILIYSCPNCKCDKNNDSCKRKNYHYIHHVAIYFGGGYIIDSGTYGVTIRPSCFISPGRTQGEYVLTYFIRPGW